MTDTSWSESAIALVPPEDWLDFACSECGGGRDRRPRPPKDGLCHACRAAARERARQARLRELRRRLPHHLRAAGVPDLFLGYSRAAWEERYGPWQSDPATSRLVDWPAGGWLLLAYGHGEGATFLGTAVFGEALAALLATPASPLRRHRGRGVGATPASSSDHDASPGEWCDVADWLRELRGGFDDRKRAWARLAEAPLAMLSGLGNVADGYGGLKAEARAELAHLLGHRRRWQRPTIVASRMASWKEIRGLHVNLRDLEVPLKLGVEA